MSGSEPSFLGTLAVHISAPRRGTQPVQYSKSLSGGPLCSQTSFSIIMPVEMQYFRLVMLCVLPSVIYLFVCGVSALKVED